MTDHFSSPCKTTGMVCSDNKFQTTMLFFEELPGSNRAWLLGVYIVTPRPPLSLYEIRAVFHSLPEPNRAWLLVVYVFTPGHLLC